AGQDVAPPRRASDRTPATQRAVRSARSPRPLFVRRQGRAVEPAGPRLLHRRRPDGEHSATLPCPYRSHRSPSATGLAQWQEPSRASARSTVPADSERSRQLCVLGQWRRSLLEQEWRTRMRSAVAISTLALLASSSL